MSEYDVEVGEDRNPSVCHCCGMRGFTGHGFIYKSDDPRAVYYATWSDGHKINKVSLAIAIGEWGDDSTSNDRTCFGIEVYEDQDEILFKVVEPETSPWPNADLMGNMLSRSEGLSHPLLPEAFQVGELVVRSHVAIRYYLRIMRANEKAI